jgi:hypothetical protein
MVRESEALGHLVWEKMGWLEIPDELDNWIVSFSINRRIVPTGRCSTKK